ncbi:MAG TPA: LamG domain-containing protein [Thermoanaerobaculia bacterium]|jgi:hypothetical protein|nr:LamG domain-containing protein [Thermoanaerobaculia bacterium]
MRCSRFDQLIRRAAVIAAMVLGGGPALCAQPLIEYRFDDPSFFATGTVANARGASYAGSLSGTRSQVRGALGNGVQFDGNSGFMSAPSTTGLNFGALTVEAFIRRDANTDEDGIVSKWALGNQFLLSMYPTGKGRLTFSVRGAAGIYGSISYDLPDLTYIGEWVHVAATYDGAGNFRLYWNGTLVASSLVPISGMATGSGPIRVGDAGNNWSRFKGAIDEVKIWNRALLAADISRPLRPRVLVVEYTSNDPTYNDPRAISTALINAVSDASLYVRYQITQWDFSGIRPPQRSVGGFDYAALFSRYDVCGKARRGDIHEVWVWAGPDGGFKAESAVTGPWREIYGAGLGMPRCDTQMVTMGFNYQRLLQEAEESFAHRLEQLYRFYWTAALWDKFDGQYYRYGYETSPPRPQPPLVTTGAHCGNAHYPPNADQTREWNSADLVSSNCATWRSDGTGTYVNINCGVWPWFCTQSGFYRWWMQNMPGPINSHGPGGTRLQNWWSVLTQ